MSRSYKKTSVVKIHNGFTRMAKNQSNKKIRKTEDISCGANYKKIYPQYNVCEFRSYMTDTDIDNAHYLKKYLKK